MRPLSSSLVLGSEKSKSRVASDIPPIGRLILPKRLVNDNHDHLCDQKRLDYQKHHLHPKDCVKTPPTIGAEIIASDSTHAIKPANTGRLFSGRICVMTA